MTTLPRLALRLTAASLVALPVAAQARVEVQTLPTVQLHAPHQVQVHAPQQAATRYVHQVMGSLAASPTTTTTVRGLAQQADPCCDHECSAQQQAPAKIGFGLPQAEGQRGNAVFFGGDGQKQELRFTTEAQGSNSGNLRFFGGQSDGQDDEREIRIRVEIDGDGNVQTHVEGDHDEAPHAAHADDGIVVEKHVVRGDGAHQILEGLMVDKQQAPHAHASEDVDVWVQEQHEGGHDVEVFKAIIVGPDGKRQEFDSREAFRVFQQKAEAPHSHDASDEAGKEKHVIWVGPHGAKHELKFSGSQELVFPAPQSQRLRWVDSGSSSPFQTFQVQSQGSESHGCCCCCGGGNSSAKQIEIHVEADVQGQAQSKDRFEFSAPKQQQSGDISFGWTEQAPNVAKLFTAPEDVQVHVSGRQGETKQKQVSPGVYTLELDGSDNPLGAVMELHGDHGGLLELKGIGQHLKGLEGLKELHGIEVQLEGLEALHGLGAHLKALEGLHDVDVHLEGTEGPHEAHGILQRLQGAQGKAEDAQGRVHRILRRVQDGEGASIELELPDFSSMDVDAIRAWAEGQGGNVQVWTEGSDVEPSSDEAPDACEAAPTEKAPGAAQASQELVIV